MDKNKERKLRIAHNIRFSKTLKIYYDIKEIKYTIYKKFLKIIIPYQYHDYIYLILDLLYSHDRRKDQSYMGHNQMAESNYGKQQMLQYLNCGNFEVYNM